MIERRLRLWTGLVLFVFVATHLLNHALGLVSLEAAEAGRLVFLRFWRGPIGTALFYPSLVAHVGLVLWAIYQRRRLRLPILEAVRLGLGLVMPLLLVPHIFGTRVLADTFEFRDTYAYAVVGMWVLHPSSALTQSVLLVVAWVHGCIGIHFWLALKPWYPRVRPLLYSVALLLPVLSLLGFAGLGAELGRLSTSPEWLARTFAGITEHDEALVQDWARVANGLFIGSVVLVFVGRQLRALWLRRHGVRYLTYPGGRRVPILPGMTILDASRSAGIPHASLCGGRGRCSTCRSRISPASSRLPRPSADEDRVLKRVGAPPNVRLACQLRPNVDLNVVPLLPTTATPADGFLQPAYNQGSEREIAILFADIRGFTRFSEHRLPYDVVFVLNQYFAAMGEAVVEAGGHLDKFIGDGVMALFGLTSGTERGCREALAAAVGMSRALDDLNHVLAHDLREPLRIGIGIHMGHVIVGEMGHGRPKGLTAIGDAVNTASRLESLTKDFKAQLIVSEDVSRYAGVDLGRFPRHEIEVRGRTMLMTITAITNAQELEPLMASMDGRLASPGVAQQA